MTRHVWLEAFSQPEPLSESAADFYVAAAEVLRLPVRSRAALRRHAGSMPTTTVLGEISKAERALRVVDNLDTPVKFMKDLYDIGTLRTLEFASLALAAVEIETAFTERAKGQIRTAVHQLLAALYSDRTLDAAVKRILFDHAEAIQHALDLVELGGSKVVLDEWDRLRGSIHRDPAPFEKAQRSPSIRRTFVALIAALGLVASGTRVVAAIGDDVSDIMKTVESVSHEQRDPDPVIERRDEDVSQNDYDAGPK